MITKLVRALLVLVVALSVSFSAAWMSIVGMQALFPGAGILIIITMIALESGKLVAAEWLHTYWKSKSVTKAHKGYLTAAIIALMMITSMGIYGFLAKGHLEQQAENAPAALQIAQKEERLKQLNTDLFRYTSQLNQINQTQDAFLKNVATTKAAQQALRARRSMGNESRSVQSNIDETNDEINKINQELVPLKVKSSAVEAKLGPIKYVAELFGWKDPEVAVRMVILLIMFVFDPFAVVMMISGTKTVGEWLEDRRQSVRSVPIEEPKEAPEKFSLGTRANVVPADEEDEGEDILNGAVPITHDMFDRWKSLVDDVEAETDSDIADDVPLVPSPKPSTWGFSPTPGIFETTPEDESVVEQHAAEEEPEVLPPITDKEILIALLEENPKLLEEVIDVVNEASREETPSSGYISWLDDKNPKDRA